ncbi:MAG: hypothetical protein IIY11_01280 [Clostridia bacterium]|nr:hypothetical protein [Clostridia bacterium]
MKKTISILMTVMMLVTLTVSAAGKIDLEKGIDLTLNYAYDGTAIKGAEFSAYRIAEVDEYARYKVLEGFAGYEITGFFDEDGYLVDEEEGYWKNVATTLSGYMTKDKVEATAAAETDENGKAHFEGLEAGIYLVIGASHRQGNYRYTAEPFLIALPGLDHEANEWAYDVEVAVKNSRKTVYDDFDITLINQWANAEAFEGELPEIEVEIYQDGDLYDTVVLNEENNWKVKVEGLSEKYEWEFVEITEGDFTVAVEQTGNKIVFTNTLPEIPEEPGVPENPPAPPAEPELPATGSLWWPVPLLAIAGVVLFMLGWMRRRSYEG